MIGEFPHPEKAQHARDIYKRAEAFGIKSFFIDGNNVVESYETLKKAIEEIRE